MLPFVWKLYAIILPVSIVAYTDDCTSLPPLTYCPPHDSARWRERAHCKRCPGHLKYHCCKDYDSPKLNCSQGDFYCKNETFVDGCAEEKFCGKGEEPVLNFIINQERVEKPEVHCVPCYNNNRYNDFKNRSSATYSECPYRKENICTPERNKIECNKPSETSERICRCDVKNGFYPYSHPNDHPEDGCSNSHYSCATGRCRQNEMMILNYTCVCKEGFLRINASNDCVSNHTTTSTVRAQTIHMNTTVRTSSTASSQNRTIALCSSPSILKTSTKDGAGIRNAVLITSGCFIFGIIVFVCVLCVLWKVHLRRKKKKKDKKDGMIDKAVNTDECTQQSPFISNDQRINVNDTDESDTNEDYEGVYSQLIPDNRVSDSTLNLSYKLSRGTRSTLNTTADSINEHSILHPETNSLDRHRYPKTNTGESEKIKIKKTALKQEIDEDLVKDVMTKCSKYLIDNLYPDDVLDAFENSGLITPTNIRNIREIPETTEKNRKILEKIRMNYKLYKNFKISLENSKQTSCLEKITQEELSLSSNRKKEQSISKDDSEESDTEGDNRSHRQRRRHTFSFCSFEFEQNGFRSNNEEVRTENPDVDLSDFDNDDSYIENDESHSDNKDDEQTGLEKKETTV